MLVYRFVSDNWSPCSVTCGEGIKTRKVYCKAHLDYTQIMTKLTDDACVGPKPPEVEKCFSMSCPLNKMYVHIRTRYVFGRLLRL